MTYINAKAGLNVLPAGATLLVTPPTGACARYRRIGEAPTYAPGSWVWLAPGMMADQLGPFETPTRWEISFPPAGVYWQRTSPPPENIRTAQIARETERVRSARIIAAALNERNELLKEKEAKMALHEKFRTLAERARQVPKRLGDQADSTLGRFDAVEKRGDEAFQKMRAVLDDMEKGVAETEDALNQLTNGAPFDTSAAS